MGITPALLMAGGSVLGAGIGAAGAQSAAGQQASASEAATAAQQQMFNTQVANESPYMAGGAGALSQLNYLEGIGTPGTAASGTGAGSTPGTAASSNAGAYGSLNAPFTIDTFHQYSPAYQFQLQQGQNGVLNADSSGQGALSGAALKDLTSFNQNYANTAFNNAFNQYQTQQTNTYSRLAGIANLGESAASNQATGGSNYAQGIGQSITNTGSALAGGTVGAANALGGAISNAGVYAAYGAGGSGNPNNNTSLATYYTADGTPYQGTVSSNGFGP